MAVIVYGSLYPFHFDFHRVAANPFFILIHSWPLYQRRDILINVLVYVPLGAVSYLAGRRWPGLLLALALSCAMEMLQVFIPGRICSMLDVVSNVTGAVLGEAGAALFRRRIACPSAFFLVLCWISYQTFPFVPDLRRLHALLPISAVETGAFAVEVAALLALIRPRYAFVLALVPLKILIIGRMLSWSDLAGLAFGSVLWFVVANRPAVVASLLAASVVMQGLSPFTFTAAPHAFAWVPFTGFLAGDWQWSFVVLFRKLFTYGSLVWFLWQSRVRLPYAALLATVLLGAIEAVQTHIAGRTAEISDPLIALLCALTFLLATPEGCAKVKETNV